MGASFSSFRLHNLKSIAQENTRLFYYPSGIDRPRILKYSVHKPYLFRNVSIDLKFEEHF